MSGRILVIVIVLSTVLAGALIYYLQVYGFYYRVAGDPGRDVLLVPAGQEQGEPIAYDGFQAIDADSSPIRYRACFTTPLDLGSLTARYQIAEGAMPLRTPGWFDCFDAPALATALEDGSAVAFVGVKNIRFGVDRIVAVTEDGQGYSWHVLNNCGKKAYDGTVVGEECPPRPPG